MRSELPSFEALRETLLKGGIAPRRVRRMIGELNDHLAALIEDQQAAGYAGEDARVRARALLGSDEDLAAAWLADPRLKSFTARAPWAVFLLMPPLGAILGFVLLLFSIALVGLAGGAIVPRHHIPLPIPAWFDWTVQGILFAANFILVPLFGVLLAWMAQRQRIKPLWPLLGMVLILMLNLHGGFHADTKRIEIHLGTMMPFYPAKGPFGPAGTIDWPTLLGQAALLCLPLAWLLRAWRQKQQAASCDG